MFRYIIITFTITAFLLVYSMWCFVTSRSMLFSSFIKKTFAFASGLKSVIPYLQKRINTHTHSNPSLSFIFGWSLHRSSLIQTISITNWCLSQFFWTRCLTRILGFEWVEGWSCEKFQSRTCQISPQFHSIQSVHLDVVVFIPFTVLTRATYSRAYYNSSSVWRRRRGCNVLKRLSQI